MEFAYLSNLIVGSWQLSAGHTNREISPLHVLESYYDAGFRVFDCADIYTGVEELLGEFIAAHQLTADDIFVHTKYVPDLAALPSLSRSQTERIIDRSRERLGLDTLDLVQFHWWNYQVPGYLEALNNLDELRRQGKIARLGLTNFDAAHVEEIVAHGLPIASIQTQYSLIDRRPRGALSLLAHKHDIALLCYGSVAGGLLSARYVGVNRPTAPYDNRSLDKYMLIVDEVGGWDALQDLLAVLADIAREKGTDVASIAAAYCLHQDAVHACIVGVRHTGHLAEHVALAEGLSLTQAQLERLEGVRDRFGEVPGAVYELERNPNGEHNRIMKFNLNAMEG